MTRYEICFFHLQKLGVMTFGGGYAMLPMLQREIVDNRGWATEEELMDYFAIGQCTPGIISCQYRHFHRSENQRKYRWNFCHIRRGLPFHRHHQYSCRYHYDHR